MEEKGEKWKDDGNKGGVIFIMYKIIRYEK